MREIPGRLFEALFGDDHFSQSLPYDPILENALVGVSIYEGLFPMA